MPNRDWWKDAPNRDQWEAVRAHLNGNDREFFERVWRTEPTVYLERLRAVGLHGQGRVLDAGCGFGQWTWGLAALNRAVAAIDVDEGRARAVSTLMRHAASPVVVSVGSIDALPYPDRFFDAVFCYGSVFIPDTRAVIKEFARVLRPGGRLVMTANGLGWTLKCLLEQPNESAHYAPRQLAAASLDATMTYLAGGDRVPGTQLVISPWLMQQWLSSAGFTEVVTGPEGTVTVGGAAPGRAFYPAEYAGYPCVYDIIAVRP